MKQYKIRLYYREKGNPEAEVKQLDLVSHSIRSAKQAFAIWHWKTWQQIDYTILKGEKLEEIKEERPMKVWVRLDQNRQKSQIYVCPLCQQNCYASSQGCDYQFCPRCGREVLPR